MLSLRDPSLVPLVKLLLYLPYLVNRSCASDVEVKAPLPRNKQLVHWNVPVPKSLDEAVENAVIYDSHVSKSDLIREAVREKLQKMGVKLDLVYADGEKKHG